MQLTAIGTVEQGASVFDENSHTDEQVAYDYRLLHMSAADIQRLTDAGYSHVVVDMDTTRDVQQHTAPAVEHRFHSPTS